MSNRFQFSLGTGVLAMIGIALLMFANFSLKFDKPIVFLDLVLSTVLSFYLQHRFTVERAPILHYLTLAICVTSAFFMTTLAAHY